MHSNRFSLPRPATGICLLLALFLSSCGGEDPPIATGLLEWDRLELIAETNEAILETMAREGEVLAQGAVILRQDSRRTQAKLDEAEAAIAQAQSRLAELKRGPREELIDEARAKLQSAQSEEDNYRRELVRAQSLVQKNLVSRESVDTARTRLNKAVADRAAARAALEALLHGTTVEELNQAEAAVAQAEARVRALSITLDNLVLKAPRSGRLDNLPYLAGERPAAGSVIAVMLINETPYARVYVPEPSRAGVHEGTKARVYVDGLSDPLPGRVRMISSEAIFTPYYSLTERDRARLSYVTEVELTDTGDGRLPSGIPVRVEFETAN